VDTNVAESLALIATGGFFEVFVRSGEVVAHVYSLDKEGVGGFWCGEGDLQVSEALSGITQMWGLSPICGVDAVDGDVGLVCKFG